MIDLMLQDADATEALGRALAGIVRRGDVITLAGPLGSGKTTLARGLLAGLGLFGDVPSPTFAVVLPYAPPDVRLPVWHADLYRLGTSGDLAELGLEDAEDGLLMVEWPGIAGPAAWPSALALTLALTVSGERRLTWEAGTAWHCRWPLRLPPSAPSRLERP